MSKPIPPDFLVMRETEQLLRKYGQPKEVVTFGRRGTRNFASALAFPLNANVPYLLADTSPKNAANVLLKTFDIDWTKAPDGTITGLRIVAYGFGKIRVATVEKKIRIKLLNSALDMVRWGIGELP